MFSKVPGKGRIRGYLIALFCGLAALNMYVYRQRIEAGYTVDYVSSSEKLLQELRRDLPPGGRVGFISDTKRSASAASQERYLLPQYAGAPVIVEEGTDADLVIVNVE
jgi:hypothetical protein